MGRGTPAAFNNQLLTRGEVEAAPYYSGRVWLLQKEGAENIRFAIPEEGALLIPYIVVVPKGSANREAAMQWLDYSASATSAEDGAVKFGYVPINEKAVIPSDQEEFYGTSLANVLANAISPDWLVIARENEERMAQVEKIIAGE